MGLAGHVQQTAGNLNSKGGGRPFAGRVQASAGLRDEADWTLQPGRLVCRLDGARIDTQNGTHQIRLSGNGQALALEGRSGTRLDCELDEAVRKFGANKTFRTLYYDGMVRLEGRYRLQSYDRNLVSEGGQALRFLAHLVPDGNVSRLERPCDGHPDFGLWRNPELGLLEYWWRDRLVTAVQPQQNGLDPWSRQVQSYLEETAARSHAAITFLAQLRRLQM